MEERYITIRVTVNELAEGRYRSRIDISPEGASQGVGSDFNLDQKRINEWAIQAPGGEAPTKANLVEVGKTLFQLIFRDTVFGKYRECVTLARERNSRMRICLAINSTNPDRASPLVAVPWEYLHDGGSFLVMQGHLIVRLIDSLPEKAAYFRPIRRLLVVVTNPTGEPRQYPPFDAAAHLAELPRHLGPIVPEFLRDPSIRALTQKLSETKADALYFLGHGQYDDASEGQLVLVDSKGMPELLDADRLAVAVRESTVRFAYLNSCSTAATGLVNPFAGVAQRLMRDGKVDAVVAMQAPVTQEAGLAIGFGFLEELGRGRSAELALARSRSTADDLHSWGVPVVYSYFGGPEALQRNRIASLLGADIGQSRFGFILPAFGMGVHLDDTLGVDVKPHGTYVFPSRESAITVTVVPPPPKTYVFPGDTHAREDVEAAAGVLGLLSQITEPATIGFYANRENRSDVTNWFLFGSRSNEIVANVHKEHYPRFQFDYGTRWPGRWSLEDLKDGRVEPKVYSVTAPDSLGKRDYAKQEDYGILQKVTVSSSKKVFFIVAGLGSRATRGCGSWLARNWDMLEQKYGAQDFGVVLHFPGGMTDDDAELIDCCQA